MLTTVSGGVVGEGGDAGGVVPDVVGMVPVEVVVRGGGGVRGGGRPEFWGGGG